MNLPELLALLAGHPVLTRKDLARRFGRDVRTIDRWKADGTLPNPVWFHGPLWTPSSIIDAERAGKLHTALNAVPLDPTEPQHLFTFKFDK